MSRNYLLEYECIACNTLVPVRPFLYACPACGSNLDAKYDYEKLKTEWSKEKLAGDPEKSIWRYFPLLPVGFKPADTSLQVGGTPLVSGSKFAKKLDLRQIFLKDDTRNPSGSLKDRATEVSIQHAEEQNLNILLAASTGNAAASLACLAAYHGKQAVILAPASAPPAKLIQIIQYGAKLYPVDGNYDDAFELSLEIEKKYGWYLRSTGINPVLSEGKKTAALELAEQLNWNLPDQVFVPVGDGCIIGGIYKGFYDLYQLGWITKLPKLVAVQAEGSNAVVKALTSDHLTAVEASTAADSISVNYPRDGEKALRAVKKTGGYGISVSDEEIFEAQHILAQTTGIFAEPAAAAAAAGVIKARCGGLVNSKESAALIITGSGLKDIKTGGKFITIPPAGSRDLKAFSLYWNKNG
ncbi:MAG: threonine synthase [Candidatus Neomarinimicrobiota bacterium]